MTKSIPAIAAGALTAIGAGVIVGWIYGLERLMTVFPGLIRMKPNTAAAFLVAAAGLYLAYRHQYRPAQAVCALVLFALGAISLMEYVWGFNAHIDEILFLDPVQIPYPGRMAPFTAATFVVTGPMLFPFRWRASEKITDLLALVVGFASTFAIVGYLYGVPILYGSSRYTSMAIHTGVGFLLLSLGFLFIEKENGFVRIFQAETAGGIVARWLIPLAMFIPIGVGLVFNRFNFGQPRLGIALIVLSNVMLFVGSIWGLAWVLDKSEVGRGAAQHESEIDVLTGIYNRRHFDRRLQEEIRKFLRHSRDSCLILFDIDHFKSLNDRFGHQGGDSVLRAIAHACDKGLRLTDILCRYGGEEFAVIAPDTDGNGAMILAGKIRKMISEIKFEKAPIHVTVSLGVTQFGGDAPCAEATIAAADRALYAAKRMGRNRECLASDLEVAAYKE